MKKFIIIGTVIFLGFTSIMSYNNIIGLKSEVDLTYAQVHNVMQRQADLIPNLAATVKGYMNHEQKTFIETAQARTAKVASIPATELANNPELQKQMFEAMKASSQALLQINAVREAYPQLKSDTHITEMMKSLEGSINRITVERQRNQVAVRNYNVKVQSVPTVIFATLFGFKSYPYFESDETARTVPKVQF